ncbi:MAG TPA: hypothetical protein PKV73_02040 [Agriterribacter sp.]|nr:hypothetical protein [Agriterribacter sp.]
MNPKTLLLFLSGILIFISCGKEESFEKKRAEVDHSGPLLVKVTEQSPGASYLKAATFTYDTHKRLQSMRNNIEGTINEPYAEQETSYFRNDKGMIKTVSNIQNVFDENKNLLLRDSIVLNLNFTAEGRYIYGIRTLFDTDNKKIRDSLVYDYNAKGRMAQVTVFRKIDDNGDYKDFQYTTYAYDEKENISTMTIKFAENGQDPPQVLTFLYNDKISPMNFEDEALLEGFIMQGLNSPNCIINVSDLTEPDNNWDIHYNEFHTSGKPLKATHTNISTREKINTTYFYQ